MDLLRRNSRQIPQSEVNNTISQSQEEVTGLLNPANIIVYQGIEQKYGLQNNETVFPCVIYILERVEDKIKRNVNLNYIEQIAKGYALDQNSDTRQEETKQLYYSNFERYVIDNAIQEIDDFVPGVTKINDMKALLAISKNLDLKQNLLAEHLHDSDITLDTEIETLQDFYNNFSQIRLKLFSDEFDGKDNLLLGNQQDFLYEKELIDSKITNLVKSEDIEQENSFLKDVESYLIRGLNPNDLVGVYKSRELMAYIYSKLGNRISEKKDRIISINRDYKLELKTKIEILQAKTIINKNIAFPELDADIKDTIDDIVLSYFYEPHEEQKRLKKIQIIDMLENLFELKSFEPGTNQNENKLSYVGNFLTGLYKHVEGKEEIGEDVKNLMDDFYKLEIIQKMKDSLGKPDALLVPRLDFVVAQTIVDDAFNPNSLIQERSRDVLQKLKNNFLTLGTDKADPRIVDLLAMLAGKELEEVLRQPSVNSENLANFLEDWMKIHSKSGTTNQKLWDILGKATVIQKEIKLPASIAV